MEIHKCLRVWHLTVCVTTALGVGTLGCAQSGLGPTPTQTESAQTSRQGEDKVSIFQAVRSGVVPQVQGLLTKNPNLATQTDPHGATPLHYASNKDVAELLISAGADVSAKMHDGRTPLHLAVQNNHEDVVRVLLDHRVDVNAKSSSGIVPLHYVKNTNIAQLLLDAQAQVNVQDQNGWTPLHWVAVERYKDVAALLIQHGGQPVSDLGAAPANARDPNTPVTALTLGSDGTVYAGQIPLMLSTFDASGNVAGNGFSLSGNFANSILECSQLPKVGPNAQQTVTLGVQLENGAPRATLGVSLQLCRNLVYVGQDSVVYPDDGKGMDNNGPYLAVELCRADKSLLSMDDLTVTATNQTGKQLQVQSATTNWILQGVSREPIQLQITSKRTGRGVAVSIFPAYRGAVPGLVICKVLGMPDL